MHKNIISFVARGSGSGKTHIIELLIRELGMKGLRVAAVKHSGHMPDMDRQGKDTYRYSQSGAAKVMMFSSLGMMLYEKREHSLDEIAEFACKGVDIVLMEGFKDGPFPKIEVYSRSVHPVPLCVEYKERFIAIVSETDPGVTIRRFSFNDVAPLADFIISFISDGGDAAGASD